MMSTTLLVCGVDESGRGSLVGSVYAAAVILDDRNPIEAVADLNKIFTDMHALLRQSTAHKTVQAILPYLDQGDRGAVR